MPLPFSPFRKSRRGFSVLFFSLALTLFPAESSLAQGAAPVTPESEWKLSDIRAPKKPGESYCTITRGFSQNIVLTIAQNQRDETSLAFDFQKDAFSPEKTYTIALNAGPGARRAFEARPLSPGALVISTGKDDAFYAGIRKGGKLDVSISGKIYSFSIDGLGQAMDRLGLCATEIRKATSETRASTTAALSKSESTSSPAPVAKTGKASNASPSKTELETLQDENRRLSDLLAQERKSYENSAMGTKNGNALTEMKEKIVLLEKENERLRTGSGAGNKALPPSPDSDSEKMKQDLSTLRTENARLRKALAEEKSARIDVPEAVSPKAFAALQEQYKTVKAENDRLRADTGPAQEDASEAPVPSGQSLMQARLLQEKLDAAEKKIQALTQETGKLRDERENILLKKADNWDAEEATRRYNEADREARRLSLLLDEKTSVCNEEKTKLEAMLFDPAVTKVEQISHLASLEEDLQKARQSLKSADSICEAKITRIEKEGGGKQVDFLRAEVSKLELEIKNAQEIRRKLSEEAEKKISEIKASMETQKSAHEQKIAALEKSLQAQKEDIASKLEQQEKVLLSEKQKTGNESKEKKREYEAAISVLQKDKADLTARLAALQSGKTQILDNEKAAIGRDILTLKANLVRKDTEFRETVSRLEAEKTALARQLQSLQAQATISRSSADSLAKNVRDVDAMRTEMTRKDLATRQQADAVKGEMEKKIAILESEKKALQFALSQIGSAGGTVSALSPRPSDTPLSSTHPASFSETRTAPPSRATARRGSLMTSGHVTALLHSANLSVSTPVESVPPAVETTAQAFRWQTGPLFGSLEEREILDSAQFGDFVSDYLARTRSHCAGDFASSPTDLPPPEGVSRLAAYEIACVSPGGGSSAALLFVARNGVFSVIAHETGTEAIDTAIDARDRVHAALASPKDRPPG